MAYFNVTRITTPEWARPPRVEVDEVPSAAYEAIQAHRDEMLQRVHQEVEAYLNTPGLYYEGDEEGFPNRSQMTGEYYVGDEYYTTHSHPVWFQIGILCRCLQKPRHEGQRDRDYLGLEVWLRCEPDVWSFTVFRNTDSSVI